MVYVGQQEERSDPPTEPALSAVSSCLPFLSFSNPYQWKRWSLSTHAYNMLRSTLEMIFPGDPSPVRRSGPSFTSTPPPVALHRKADKTAYQNGRVCNNVISKTVLFHPLWELDRPKKKNWKKWLHSPKRGRHYDNNPHIYPLFLTTFAVIFCLKRW